MEENRLKALREKLGMTKKKITEILGIPYRTWCNWEDGSRQCPEYIENLIIFYMKHRLDEE